MTAQETEYANTDLDLVSASAFDAVVDELKHACHVLSYTQGADNRWYAVIESKHGQDYMARTATLDINSIIQALEKLSIPAKLEFDRCERRDFNIGFHCWETWSYNHALPNDVLRSIAALNGTLSITLYPMRNPDGTPKV